MTASARNIRRGSAFDRALNAQAHTAEIGERALRHARAGDLDAAHRVQRKADATAQRALDLANDAALAGDY